MSTQFKSVLGDDLVQIGRRSGHSKPCGARTRTPSVNITKKRPAPASLGCETCPLNDEPGIRKVKRLKYVTGKSIFVWGIAPGMVENNEGEEFLGPSGQMLWQELRRVGIRRRDCDVQNVVRCWPTEEDPVSFRIKDRAPTKAEIKCCSVYTHNALARNAGKAAVHLVFGQVAAQALLGREYKKSVPTFWSEKLQAKVYVMQHPSYFLRGGSRHRLQEWRIRLGEAAKDAKRHGRFTYLEEQDYRLVRNRKTAMRAYRAIKAAAKRGKYTAFDIEYGWTDKNGQACKAGEGQKTMLVIGFCWTPGVSRVFVLDHPDAPLTKKERPGVLEALGLILSDKTILKCAHHGTADVKPIEELLGIKVNGYDFDTNYSTYLKWPQLKAYGLDNLSQQRVPMFAGYKDIVHQYLDVENPNYATIPLKVMVLYNGGDCDVCRRLQYQTRDKRGPLLRTYKDVAFVLDDMQTRGPYFDKKYYDTAVARIPARLKKVTRDLRVIARDPEMNLNTPAKIAAVVYDKLKFEPIEGYSPRSTAAEVLRMMSQNPKKGEFPKLVIEYRELSRMEGTYLKNYLESAELNDGQLRTLWWLTGTITGRLRSGGRKNGQQGIINFQNLHGEPMLQNLLISDPRWRRIYQLKKSLSKREWDEVLERVLDLQVFLAFDYAQIEIRIAAEISGDPLLLAAIASGDIHTAVGYELTGWDKDKIKNDKQVRTLIKNIHFGILYGMSKKSLYQFLLGLGIQISEHRCAQLHDRYFHRFRKVREMIEDLQRFAERHGYVETLFGFRRPINLDVDEDGRGTYWGNQAINSPIQGTAHQLLLFAMATLHRKRNTYKKLQVPVMEVHDALDFYVKLRDLPEARAEGISLLQSGVNEYIAANFKKTLSIPLVAESTAGFRLGVMPEYHGGDVVEFLKGWKRKNKEVEEKIESKWGTVAA